MPLQFKSRFLNSSFSFSIHLVANLIVANGKQTVPVEKEEGLGNGWYEFGAWGLGAEGGG